MEEATPVHLFAGPPGEDLLAALEPLVAAVFGQPHDELRWRLTQMPCVSLALARAADDGRLLAFKAGYAMTRRKYYSWLGGVHPDARRLGLASRLMGLQHDWARGQGFDSVETSTGQDNIAMTQANLKHGFHVCGLRHEPQRVQVLFAKRLAPAA